MHSCIFLALFIFHKTYYHKQHFSICFTNSILSFRFFVRMHVSSSQKMHSYFLLPPNLNNYIRILKVFVYHFVNVLLFSVQLPQHYRFLDLLKWINVPHMFALSESLFSLRLHFHKILIYL
jgi:hypothetical protein